MVLLLLGIKNPVELLAARTTQSFGAKLNGFALSAPISFNGLLMYLPMLLNVSKIDVQRVVLYD